MDVGDEITCWTPLAWECSMFDDWGDGITFGDNVTLKNLGPGTIKTGPLGMVTGP